MDNIENNKSIFFHVGAPKTATTFIQSTLEQNKNSLNNHNYDVVLPEQIRGTAFFKYLYSKHVNEQPTVSISEAKDNFDSIISQSKQNNIIISEEGILNKLMPSERTNKAFFGIKNSANAIKTIIDKNTTIILTIRNQINFIESTYKHHIKWILCNLNFEGFLKRHIDLKKLSWKKVIDELEEFFPGQVKVVPYELIKISPQKYFNKFLISCGAQNTDNEIDFSISNRIENKAMADNQAQFMRLINKAYRNTATNVHQDNAWEIFCLTQKLFNSEPRKSLPSFKFSESAAHEIKAYYREENIKILSNYCNENEVSELMKYY